MTFQLFEEPKESLLELSETILKGTSAPREIMEDGKPVKLAPTQLRLLIYLSWLGRLPQHWEIWFQRYLQRHPEARRSFFQEIKHRNQTGYRLEMPPAATLKNMPVLCKGLYALLILEAAKIALRKQAKLAPKSSWGKRGAFSDDNEVIPVKYLQENKECEVGKARFTQQPKCNAQGECVIQLTLSALALPENLQNQNTSRLYLQIPVGGEKENGNSGHAPQNWLQFPLHIVKWDPTREGGTIATTTLYFFQDWRGYELNPQLCAVIVSEAEQPPNQQNSATQCEEEAN